MKIIISTEHLLKIIAQQAYVEEVVNEDGEVQHMEITLHNGETHILPEYKS